MYILGNRLPNVYIMSKNIKIKDVADLAGVSTATVSRFLNGKYQSMSESTRLKIASIIENIGYQPNNIARSLRSRESKTIAIIMADIFNPYSMDVLRGIEEFCSEEGYKIFVCDAKNSSIRERTYIEEMINLGVDGFIINTTGENDAFIKGISLEYPVVLIGRKIKNSNITSIVADNSQGMKLAIEHALTTEPVCISYLTSTPGNVSPRTERLEVFESYAALTSLSHITFSCVQLDVISRESVTEALKRLVSTVHGKQIIITGNGLLSLHVIHASGVLDKHIPNDFSLIGFDETEWAEILKNPLTVVAQPTYKIGSIAAKKLINNLKETSVCSDEVITYLPFSLIVRQTA